jgi:anti-sigma regulatory factor (Ser/Thr protein kinase)
MRSRRASRIAFPALPARVQEARDFADEAAAAFGFDESTRYDIKLAATEAVTNAIRHGASSSRDMVHLSVIAKDSTLIFRVVDHGSFVPYIDNGDALPEQGRGLAFNAHLMDEVCIRTGERGTVVQFSKSL